MATLFVEGAAGQEGGVAGLGQVKFQQTVPRELVHRAAVSEVFVTDMRVVGDDRFVVGAQWPRAHSFYGPRAGGWHDPLLLVETVRQAGLLVAHQAYGVAQGDQFSWHEVSFSVNTRRMSPAERPAEVVLEVAARDVRARGRSVVGMGMRCACYRDGCRVGTCAVRWSRLSPAAYARVRGRRYGARSGPGQAPRAVAPGLVGRDVESDVLLAASPRADTWLLRVDTGHPVLFDHPIDHVPGMLTMEAARQAALLVTGQPRALPVRGAFAFTSYIELDEPCLVHADAQPAQEAGTVDVAVVLEQGDAVPATGAVELRVPS